MAYTPARGDVVWINFDPQAGHEQKGRRPAVVVSSTLYNGRSDLALICPVTNRIKNYPFEVVLPAGLPVTGAVLCDQVKNVDWTARDTRFLCALPVDILELVIAKIEAIMRS